MTPFTDIVIHPLASSNQEEHYLLSYRNQYYEATFPVVELLWELQQKPTREEAVSAYMNKKGGKYTAEQVGQIIEKYIMPLFFTQTRKRTFLYEKELLTASDVDAFSDRLRFMFNKYCMTATFALALILNSYFFITADSLLEFSNGVNVYTVMGLVVFTVISSFIHELGHASACKHFGLKHGGIGFGLYLNFPVLYTDVTEIWKLNRKKRCIVNIAGVYFQLFCLIGLLCFFFFTGYDILRYMILMMDLGVLMTLNPFFKFDGYWIVSDVLGVPNLRNRSKELFRYFHCRICKRPVAFTPYLFQIRRKEKYGLLVYALVVNLFMGYYFCYVIPLFLYQFLMSFPEELQELILYLSNNMTPPFALLRNLVMQLLFLSLIVLMIVNLIRSLKRHVR